MTTAFAKPIILKDVDGEHHYVKAHIYYYGWDVMTRTRISLNDVRTSFKIEMIVLDSYEIERLITLLNLDDFIEVKNIEMEKYSNDPRLVIDLYDSKGVRTTYYASRFKLLSEDSSLVHSIDGSFRSHFTFSR
jgi:hypothetical protein